MKIDEYLLKYDFSEKHDASIIASPEEVYKALLDADFSQSLIIRVLFWIRGLKKVKFHNFEDFFTRLENIPSKEIVLV